MKQKIIQIAVWITRAIHCSIQQSESHYCSLFSHCYIAIHLISGLKLQWTPFVRLSDIKRNLM